MEKIKKRNGFLTGFLVIIFVINLALGLYYVLGNDELAAQGLGRWIEVMLGIAALANAVCAIALFKLKKWGFWGIGIVAILMFLFNVIYLGLPLVSSLAGLVIIPLVYGFLRIGKENEGWKQLD